MSEIPAKVHLYLILSLRDGRGNTQPGSEVRAGRKGGGRILFFVAIMGNLFNLYPPLSHSVSRVCM